MDVLIQIYSSLRGAKRRSNNDVGFELNYCSISYVISITILLNLFIAFSPASAHSTCYGKFPNPITDVCWSCLFPITLGPATVSHTNYPDTTNPKSLFCHCPGTHPIGIGISIGYWEPIAMVDVTRTPFCMVNFGGHQIKWAHYYRVGSVDTAKASHGNSFYHVHWYRYPLLYWLNILTDALCVEKGDIDVPFISEFDPTWHDDALSFLANPEALLFATPPMQASCALDSLASMKGLPIDKLFWCAGSHGSMYPLSGYIQEQVSGAQASTLITERTAFLLHRLLFLSDSGVAHPQQLCHAMHYPVMTKSRYRYQMLYPSVSGHDHHCCYPFGHSTLEWESEHSYPMKGEHYGYLVWRKRNCCLF